MYSSGSKVHEIAKHIGHRATYVSRVLKDCGMKPVKGRSVNRNVNDSYFDELDSDKKAYYIGLLFADGSVANGEDGRSPMIRVELASQDSSVLDDLRRELQITSDIRTNKRDGKNETRTLSVRSRALASSLAKYGIVPNKTYLSEHLPDIPQQYVRQFIHGLIDGDGSVYFSQGAWHINFCSHFKSICEEFERICSSIIKKDTHMAVQSSNGVHRITYNGAWALALAKECIVGKYGIDRKRMLAELMFET